MAKQSNSKQEKILRILSTQTIDPSVLQSIAIECGKVVRVLDGDTIEVVAPVCTYSTKSVLKSLCKFRVRLAGIDAPEIHTHNEAERQAGCMSRAFLSSLVLNQAVIVNQTGQDKYGRILARITCNGIDINEKMLQEKHARPYFGGKKEPYPIDS